MEARKEVKIDIPAVEDWTTAELRRCCKKSKVKGYSKLSRAELVEAVKDSIKQFNKDTHDEHRKTDAAKEKLKKVVNAVNNIIIENNCTIGAEIKNGEIRIIFTDHDSNMIARLPEKLELIV